MLGRDIMDFPLDEIDHEGGRVNVPTDPALGGENHESITDSTRDIIK